MVGQASACDPVHHEQMVRPWDLCHTPVERGEFRYRMRYMKLPGMTLYREVFDLGCRLQGASPVDTFAFSVPLSSSARSTYWGSTLDASGMPVMLPGGLDVALEPAHEQLVVLIDLSLMRSNLPADVMKGFELAAAEHVLRASRKDLSSLSGWFSGLIDTASQTPGMLQHAAVLRSVAEDALRLLERTVSLSLRTLPRPPYSLRQKGLRRALEYLRHASLENQSIPEVSRAAGVSQRTLEYAFRDVFGLTPLQFLKLRRLHATRRDLLCASPQEATVMAIAYRHGLYHPSRFARNYRRLFGEQPSVTLARSSRSSGRELFPLLG
jgi:AraC family ethanolamine operon transcriptional activator